MSQVIRIIGGHHRGKKINFPDAALLRPTPSRIRETLFNWLMHDLRGARCLDAFAGSGALGFEAWSRGAGAVTLIENAQKTYLNLKKQADAFDANNIRVIKDDAVHYFNQTKDNFDIIFLDPPFSTPAYLTESLALLAQRNILAPNGLVYTESKAPLTLNATHWQTLKEKKAGLVYYALHQKQVV